MYLFVSSKDDCTISSSTFNRVGRVVSITYFLLCTYINYRLEKDDIQAYINYTHQLKTKSKKNKFRNNCL